MLASFRSRLPAMVETLEQARRDDELPIVYANDALGDWRGDRPSFVRSAIDRGLGGDVVTALEPRPEERFLFKPRYSAFDRTPLALILEESEVERVVLLGAATESCVVQTAIDARELGLQATIVGPACATADPEVEQVALAYAARVGGVHVVSSLDDARS
ncbi:MAG TPA: isochorismatase family cysteine hydrolase [Gaiellaceae bacterium]